MAALTSSTTLVRVTLRAPGSIARTLVRHAIGAGLTATAVTSLTPAAAFAQTTTPPDVTTPTVTTPTVTTPTVEGDSGSTPPSSIGEPIIMVRLPAVDPAPGPTGERSSSSSSSSSSSDDADDATSGAAVMVSLDAGTEAPTEPGEGNEEPDPAMDGGTAAATGPVASDHATLTPSSHPATDTPHAAPVDRPTDAAPGARQGDEGRALATSDTWRIEAGDHLWAIAAETLADEWGHAPSDDEVLHYWDDLLVANRDRLVDPTNPDLVFPGQELVLPPVPTTAAIGG